MTGPSPIDTIREALDAALTEMERQLANLDWRVQLEHSVRMETRALLEAAEQRANDLADALDRVEAETQEPHIQAIARAALDRHTREAVT